MNRPLCLEAQLEEGNDTHNNSRTGQTKHSRENRHVTIRGKFEEHTQEDEYSKYEHDNECSSLGPAQAVRHENGRHILYKREK